MLYMTSVGAIGGTSRRRTRLLALREEYLPLLRKLPFVRRVSAVLGGAREADACLRIRTPTGEHELLVEQKTSFLDRASAEHLVESMAQREPGWVLMAPAISTELGQRLAERRVNFLDLRGNCFIALGEQYLASVEGRQPVAIPARDKSIRAPGYQTLFALLGRPDLIGQPLRAIAEAAGVSRQAAVDALARLVSDGALLSTKRGYVWAPKGWNDTVDRWLVGYRDAIRPRLLVGRYRAPERDPELLEQRIRAPLDAIGAWRWGGSAAGFRLTQHHRGPVTVVHLHTRTVPDDLPRRLKALPDHDGSLVVLRTPGEVALDGKTDDTVHPLLVYAEMLVEGSERAREAAAALRERFLTPP
jgi:hypothetical protein